MRHDSIVVTEGTFKDGLAKVKPEEVLTLEELAFKRMELGIAHKHPLEGVACYPAAFVGYTAMSKDGPHYFFGNREAFLQIVAASTLEFYDALQSFSSQRHYTLTPEQVEWVMNNNNSTSGKILEVRCRDLEGPWTFTRTRNRTKIILGQYMFGMMYPSIGTRVMGPIKFDLLHADYIKKHASEGIICTAVTCRFQQFMEASLDATVTDKIGVKDHGAFVTYAAPK